MSRRSVRGRACRRRRRRSKSELTIPEMASATSLQGRLRANRKGKKHRGAGEEPQHHHNTKPEQNGVRHAEWDLHHHCRQVREQQHGPKAEGGK
jgi:hypothetical protein